jgi:hypothetical protein
MSAPATLAELLADLDARIQRGHDLMARCGGTAGAASRQAG